jgi:hypothetical protein
MDETSFDRMVRAAGTVSGGGTKMNRSLFERLSVVAGQSRRSALRAALAGTAVATTALATSYAGGDARKKKRKKCKKKTCPECPDCPDCPDCPTCDAVAPGQMCVANVDCCPNETNFICAFRGGNGPFCCGSLDAPCTEDTECCTGFTCFDGVLCKPTF